MHVLLELHISHCISTRPGRHGSNPLVLQMSVVAIFAEAVVSRVHSFYLILFILYAKMVLTDDFSLGPVLPETNGSKGAPKGMKRTWLKAFETPPPQMLCAYGLAKYVTMSDEEVWSNVIQPLRSGAEYMT